MNRLSGFGPITDFQPSDTHGYAWMFRDSRQRWHDVRKERLMECCPYGHTGDRLWVRETWGLFKKTPDDHVHACLRGDRRADGFEPHYRATDTWDMPAGAWRPSIHMPRWASRLTLEITGVRVEQLQDISIEDAKAEGAWGPDESIVGKVAEYFGTDEFYANPRRAFQMLWEQINGAESWAANPWVWAIEFKKLEAA